jgi:hypothetical protein
MIGRPWPDVESSSGSRRRERSRTQYAADHAVHSAYDQPTTSVTG